MLSSSSTFCCRAVAFVALSPAAYCPFRGAQAYSQGPAGTDSGASGLAFSLRPLFCLRNRHSRGTAVNRSMAMQLPSNSMRNNPSSCEMSESTPAAVSARRLREWRVSGTWSAVVFARGRSQDDPHPQQQRSDRDAGEKHHIRRMPLVLPPTLDAE